MERGIPIAVLAVVMGVVFVGGVWAQPGSLPGVFSGTVTKVDGANKEFAVQNSGDEMLFRWTDATRVNGPPVENLGLDSRHLKAGMKVTIAYSKGNPGKIANWIYVEAAKIKALKGSSLPFECGGNAC